MQQRFDEWLEEKLNERGWQAADLARASQTPEYPRGFDPGLISRWRKPPPMGVVPTPPTLDRLATAFAVARAEVYAAAGRLSPDADRAIEVDARRQAVRDQLDRWLTAVGPQYEDLFWSYLKAHGDSTVTLIRGIGTAVNTGTESAVNDAVSTRRRRGRKRGRNGNGPLTPHQHAPSEVLTGAQIHRHQRQAA